MVMAKITGAVLVLLAATVMGMMYSQELQKRIDNLYEIQKLLILLQGEMKYHQAPIIEVFQGMEGHVNREFEELLQGVAESLEHSFGKTIQQVWRECCKQRIHKISLAKQDRQEFVRLGEVLGYLDTATQMAGFELYSHKLEVRIQQCTKELAGKQRLIRCLGVAGGIFIVILFI